MKLFGNTNNPNETPRQKLSKQYASGRSTLLSLVIFSAINMVLLLLDSGTYFLFSATVPYYLTAFCMGMDAGIGSGAFFTIVAVVISLVILGGYLLCWILSKKNPGWMTAAFIFLIIDSVVLVIVSLLIPDMLLENIMDFLFHGLLVVSVGAAVSANNKLKSLPPENPVTYDGYTGYEGYNSTYNGNPEF